MGILIVTLIFFGALIVYFVYRRITYGTWFQNSSTTVVRSDEALLSGTTF